MGLRRVIAERVELIRYRLIERAEKEARERAIRARRYRFHAKNHVLDRRGGWTWSVEKESLENAVARRRQAERKEKRREEALSFLPAGLSRAVARMSTGGEGEAARKAERGVRSRVRAFVAGFFESDEAGRLDYERLYPAEKSWDELVRETKAAAEEAERMMMVDMEAAEGVMHTDAFESVRRRVAENAPIRSEWPPRLSEEDISEREREFFESLGASMAPLRVPREELPVYPDPDPADEAGADPDVVSPEDMGARFDLDMGLVADGEGAAASPERDAADSPATEAIPEHPEVARTETPDPAETASESATTEEIAEDAPAETPSVPETIIVLSCI